MAAEWKGAGKDDDFDDEGLPLLRKHTKVCVPPSHTKINVASFTIFAQFAWLSDVLYWLPLGAGDHVQHPLFFSRKSYCHRGTIPRARDRNIPKP